LAFVMNPKRTRSTHSALVTPTSLRSAGTCWFPVVTAAVEPPDDAQAGAVVTTFGSVVSVVTVEAVGAVVVSGRSVVTLVDAVGSVEDEDLPLPPPHEARTKTSAVTRNTERRTPQSWHPNPPLPSHRYDPGGIENAPKRTS